MSSRSKVAIAIRYNVWETLPEDMREWLGESDEVYQNEAGFLFILDDIKWPIVSMIEKDDSSDEVENLIRFLKTQPESDYLVVEACYDYPDSDDGDMGSWNDNPWNVRRVISVDISFDEPENLNLCSTGYNP